MAKVFNNGMFFKSMIDGFSNDILVINLSKTARHPFDVVMCAKRRRLLRGYSLIVVLAVKSRD